MARIFSHSPFSYAESRAVSNAQLETDASVLQVSREATNGHALLAMTSASFGFQFGKILSSGLLRSIPILNHSAALVQFLSSTIGLSSEVLAYEAAQRSFAALENPGIVQNTWRESFFSGLVNFGTLKLGHHLFSAQNFFLREFVSDSLMVTGHHLAHALDLEKNPEGSLLQQFARAATMNLGISAGMTLLHGMSGGRLQKIQQALGHSIHLENSHTFSIPHSQVSSLPSMGRRADPLPFLTKTAQGIRARPKSEVLREAHDEAYKEIVHEALRTGESEGATAEMTDVLRESYVEELTGFGVTHKDLSLEEILEQMDPSDADPSAYYHSSEQRAALEKTRTRANAIREWAKGKNLRVYQCVAPEGKHEEYLEYAFDNLMTLEPLSLYLKGTKYSYPPKTFFLIPGELMEYLEQVEGENTGVPVSEELRMQQVLLNFVRNKLWPLHLSRHRAFVHGHDYHPWYARYHDCFHLTRRNSIPVRMMRALDRLSFEMYRAIHTALLQGEGKEWKLVPYEQQMEIIATVAKVYEAVNPGEWAPYPLKIYETLSRVKHDFGVLWLEHVLLAGLSPALAEFPTYLGLLEKLTMQLPWSSYFVENFEQRMWHYFKWVNPETMSPEQRKYYLKFSHASSRDFFVPPDLAKKEEANARLLDRFKTTRALVFRQLAEHIFHCSVINFHRRQKESWHSLDDAELRQGQIAAKNNFDLILQKALELERCERLAAAGDELPYRISQSHTRILLDASSRNLQEHSSVWRFKVGRSRQVLEKGQLGLEGDFIPTVPAASIELLDSHSYQPGQIVYLRAVSNPTFKYSPEERFVKIEKKSTTLRDHFAAHLEGGSALHIFLGNRGTTRVPSDTLLREAEFADYCCERMRELVPLENEYNRHLLQDFLVWAQRQVLLESEAGRRLRAEIDFFTASF